MSSYQTGLNTALSIVEIDEPYSSCHKSSLGKIDDYNICQIYEGDTSSINIDEDIALKSKIVGSSLLFHFSVHIAARYGIALTKTKPLTHIVTA